MKVLGCEVPDAMHTQVKIHALMCGMTIKEYLLSLIQRDLAETQKENE